MAADKYVPSSNDGMVGIGVLTDAVKWDGKGNKIVFGNVADLTPDPNLNIRFRGGSEVFGLKLERDSYDLPGMKQQIADGGGILEPITVSVRKDGAKVPLRGNRRTYAGKEMVDDPTTPEVLRKTLTTRTPMILMHNLTTEQERELVNDQTQKRFLRSEVIRYIFSLRKQQWSYEKIAMLLWETLGQFTGNAKKLAEVREITDPALKRDKIKTWLRGSLDNYLVWGYDLGQLVQKTILLSEMRIDGLLAPNQEKAYFDTTKDSQKRIAALRKARDADGARWNGMVLIPGSEFEKVFNQFRDEDAKGTSGGGGGTGVPKMLERKIVEGLRDSMASRVARALADRILGNEVADLDVVDQRAGVFETKVMLLEGALPGLRPEIAAIVRVCLTNPDPTDFQRFLSENQMQVPPTNPDPVVEADPQDVLTDDGATEPDGTFRIGD